MGGTAGSSSRLTEQSGCPEWSWPCRPIDLSTKTAEVKYEDIKCRGKYQNIYIFLCL